MASPVTMVDGATGGPGGTVISKSPWSQRDLDPPTTESPASQAPPAPPEPYLAPPEEPVSWSSPQPGPDPWQAPPSSPDPWQAPPSSPDPWQQPQPPGRDYWQTQPDRDYWQTQPGPDHWQTQPGPDHWQASPAPGPDPRQFRPAGPPPRRPGQGRSRKPLLPFVFGGIAVLVAGGLAAAYFVLRPFHTHQTAAATTPPPAASHAQGQQPSSPTPGPTAKSVSAQQQAAGSLAGLLKQSVADRKAIVQAVSDVEQCGPNLNQDPHTFQSAASSRESLLSQLAGLPQRSALPAAMLADLTTAWQNSVKADQDFAQWAQDEISHGCTQNGQSDPGAQAAEGPDAQATTSKQAFVSRWNPIATRYGLPTYQWNQL